jgi:ceramide glucosyltransferase
MIPVMASVFALLSIVGLLQAALGWRLVRAFAARAAQTPASRPPVTVLKPLHGDEPGLQEALATLCRQQYPEFQIVFGVADPADPAVAVVRALCQRFPGCDIALVVDPARHGANLKIGNLINMLPAALHDILVIADSDVHVRPDYLSSLLAALDVPNAGLVTTLYVGLPATPDWVSRLGAAQITHGFLPGALMARWLGRRDCLGATMCLRRADLERIGGFRALVNHLADDNVLGRRIAALGLDIALADTVPLTTVPETRLGPLFRHELRWARTIRTLEPVGFAASALQYPLFWALLAVLCAPNGWSVLLFGLAWLLRGIAVRGVESALAGKHERSGLAFRCPLWLLPPRDILSVAVMLASYGGRQVDWRGHAILADTPPRTVRTTLRPIEGSQAR